MKTLLRREGPRLVVLIAFLLFGRTAIHASKTSDITSWWPDASTGLMWTGSAVGYNHLSGLKWSEAVADCSALRLGGYTDWRLPTVDEANKTISRVGTRSADYDWGHHLNNPRPTGTYTYYDVYQMNGSLIGEGSAWTSIPDGPNYWVYRLGPVPGYLVRYFKPDTPEIPLAVAKPESGGGHIAFCVRKIEPSLMPLVEQAQPSRPVNSLELLKAYVPYTKAFQEYQRGQFKESIADLELALKIFPQFNTAQWGIGICYSALQQWDDAKATFKAMQAVNKNDEDVADALAWVTQMQRAAGTNRQVKAETPIWAR